MGVAAVSIQQGNYGISKSGMNRLAAFIRSQLGFLQVAADREVGQQAYRKGPRAEECAGEDGVAAIVCFAPTVASVSRPKTHFTMAYVTLQAEKAKSRPIILIDIPVSLDPCSTAAASAVGLL